ncbi:hypothetical protein VP01_1873g2 [Puccinia sorghi]|uniref:Uncharacterized protein n=1 Tax=Puccinia sorghi TaxID=27349 RepID=A0A0L6VDR6_9BASI|nr:hypothetical protein VP01_1873g2 [Puccinia sorghi]
MRSLDGSFAGECCMSTAGILFISHNFTFIVLPGRIRLNNGHHQSHHFKNTIEAILINALLKLGHVNNNMLNGQPKLEEDDNTTLCAVILSKLSTTIQRKIVTFKKKDNTQLLWKAILKINIEIFITNVRSAIIKMEDIGIKLEEDIITHDLLQRFQRSLDNTKQSITIPEWQGY